MVILKVILPKNSFKHTKGFVIASSPQDKRDTNHYINLGLGAGAGSQIFDYFAHV